MRALLFLWVLFSLIAAAMAYLITYDEYRHHFPERSRVVQESMRTALATLLIFLVLGVFVTALLPRITR